MSVETYVYAIVGVHCTDVCTTKAESVRGCDHPESASGLPESAAKFCAVCGEKMWVDSKTETCLSDKLEHLSPYSGDEADPDEEIDEAAIQMIYSPLCGPTYFVVGRVLEEHDSEYEDKATPFDVLTDLEWATAYEQTKAVLEPLGLWDAKKFGYMLYAISM